MGRVCLSLVSLTGSHSPIILAGWPASCSGSLALSGQDVAKVAFFLVGHAESTVLRTEEITVFLRRSGGQMDAG